MTCCCFGFCGTQRFFFFFLSVCFGFLSLLCNSPCQVVFPSIVKEYTGTEGKVVNYFSESRELFADRLATFMWFEMPNFSLFGGRIFFFFLIFSFVIFYSHYVSLLSLTFSALCMWPEVALLVTGCSNEITKSSVALWLTGVFRWMLMLL